MTGLQDFNTVAQVARYLGVSRQHLYRLLYAEALGYHRVGTLVRIRREDVERFLAENAHGKAKEEAAS